ncbi:hypothetical protein QFC21_001974 [Naganishia friedmannii]|uniref:Uncharacterized protein n=1 Tax=Naganishia friedmannii TaxID=89922 RepID=A0ACC2VZC1_9TREE|nr:hypothetical protein QFC21_001974 [Naganishia friedmannii]
MEANGFHTVRFHDEAAVRTEDAGLLGWFTGAVLKTAVSALHMLRYNAQDFGFHVLPASLAARVTTGEQGHHHFERGGRSVDVPAELPDGCGTLVLVNKRVAKDRAMVVIVRPPWLIGSAELKDFARAASNIFWELCQLDWRQGSPTYLETQEGQANLLQAQVFDDCYSNYCFFFCVTNLKHWVFGHFASRLSFNRILTLRDARSFDERPQAETTAARSLPPEHGQPEEIPASSRLQLIPASVRPRGSFLPAHDSGSALGTGHPYQQGYGYGNQYTDVQARHHTSLPSWNSSKVFAAPCTPSQGHPYANSSPSTRPSWYDMRFQQRHPTSGGDSSQYPPSNYSGAPPYLPYYHSTSSPPISPLGSTPTHATYFEDDRLRTRDSFGRRRRIDE